jgi:hypothetical protein
MNGVEQNEPQKLSRRLFRNSLPVVVKLCDAIPRGGSAHARPIAGAKKAGAASKPPDLRLPAAEMRRLVERVSREMAKLAAQKGA